MSRRAAAGRAAARLSRLLARANEGVALAVGAALLAAAGWILADVLSRRLGAPLGHGEEIGGYVMAGATSWGFAYALTALAHVRIDLARARLPGPGRAAADVLAMWALAGVAAFVATKGWDVLATTLDRGARANTPLETPLWIPQLLWWSGWVWFATCATLLALCAAIRLATGDAAGVEEAAGPGVAA